MKPTQGYKEWVFLTQQGEEISWGLLLILAGVWGTQHQNFGGRTSSEQHLLLCSLAQGCALLSPNLLLPALDSAPRRCTSHRLMDQLIKECTLILSFVLLWDYNFPHLKVERYAKNSDPINKGEGTSQGTAVVQCEHWAKNLLVGKPQNTSLYRERQHIIQTALLHSLASHQHGDFEEAASGVLIISFSLVQLLGCGMCWWEQLFPAIVQKGK